MFRIEIENAEGEVRWHRHHSGGQVQEWKYPEQADKLAEELWQYYGETGMYARFSVIEGDGTVYTDWEC